MGVKGLWKLIESAGVPVPLETLEHKVLGVDVSIWLHQAVRGFRGPGGAAVANAHLLTLFHRICKLLFYRIRPVFVFDGGVPHLKKQTLASRKLRREVATNKAKQVRERLYKNLLKSQAVRSALGKSGPGPSSVHVPQVTKREKDLFELPPLPEPMGEGTTEDLEEEKGNSILQCDNLPNLHHFNFDSEEFKNLPLEAKHEILTELQDTRKQNSWANINDMPQQSENFADFQMSRLMKRAKFQATLDSTREEIQKAKVSEMETELFGNIEKYMSLSKRIISEDASHAIFIKKVKEPSKSNSETVDAESQEPVKKMDRKGKAPLKRKKPIDKDFLTELAKTGIIRPGKQDSDSDSDFENDNFHLLQRDDEQDVSEKWQQCTSEDENFLQVVGSLMENSGLTQEEILALIKQDQSENPNVSCKNEIHDGPSTSANAPGSIFNPDDSSSDEDNFIEVSSGVPSPKVEKGQEEKDVSANNIDKLLGTKTNSLWMKIVQQKLDDMVHINTLKTSPKKAIMDSRKLETKVVEEHKTSKDNSEILKPVKISLDFEVKPLKMEDNIFSDIFTDLNGSIVEEKRIGNLTSTSNYWRGSSEEDKVTYDEVEIMSSSDETDDEDDITVKCKNSTDNSHPSDRNSEDGDFMEVESDDGESVNEQEEKEQEERKVPPHSHDNERSSEITKKSKNVSGEDISVTSKKKIKVTMSDDEKGITNENMKQKVALNNSDSSTVAEAKSHQDTDIKEERKANVTDIKEEVKADDTDIKEDRKLNGTGIEEERKVNGKGTEEEREANDADIKEEREADVTDEMMGVQVAEFDRPLDYTEDELKHLEGELASEQQALVAQAQRCDRLASSLNDQMYGEAQHLLQLFGIPYLVAPMEAEAQCAFLNTVSLTEGTITDDSDIFLFGGNSVYRNFFNQTRHVEHFKIENIKSTLGLERCKMITLALLCGSDYTEGIEGIGSVGAMEVLAEFPGKGIECLENVRKWWNGAHKGISTIQHSKIRQKLAQVSLPESFPNKGVFDAYLVPEVDESKEKFSWAVPNVEALRVFTGEKFGWNFSKTDEILIPVMKRLKLKTTQKRIESYFTNIRLVKEPKVASKRMQDAIAKARGIRPPESHSTGQTKVKQKQNERRVRKGPERKQVSEESKADSEVATDSKSSKPSRTLLIDPSEIKSESAM
ncbi:hypothetical protein O3P69_008013 [Scylla paramamosain]|uniref:DNA repair protein complementing XP-G cells n=1 Tax=Scylla paramamosain TaxID=85552 RepID=A0AAW0SZC7_SCYPA